MSRILVVDDDPSIRELMIEILQNEAGHEVIAAGDAESCFEVLNHTKVDLILSDLHLGGLEYGVSLYQQLSTGPRAYPTPIAIVSGVSENIIKRENVTHYLVKPFDIDDLIALVESILLKSHQEVPLPRA